MVEGSASGHQEATMRGYGQFCPVAKAAEVFAERWTPLVVRELLVGSAHFNDLHRGVPLMSRTLLSLRLKQLEETGVVERKLGVRGPEYSLTEAGREFAPLVQMLGEWGQRWYRTTYDKNELDVQLLMWDLHRAVKPEAFPPGQVSVQFDFRDQPASKRRWWLTSDGAETDLCPTDPGFEVNLVVSTDVRTLTQVMLGDLTVKGALAAGKIELDGSRAFRQCFEKWLGLSRFADIKRAKRAA
jgi:DNA-binding HxlR family transcriptional regulator